MTVNVYFFHPLQLRLHRFCLITQTHSVRVVHSTSYSDATLRGRPTLGPYKKIFPDVLLRPVVRRTLYVRPIRTRRWCNVFSTSATNKDVRKTFIRAQSRASAQRPWTSCRVGRFSHGSHLRFSRISPSVSTPRVWHQSAMPKIFGSTRFGSDKK